MTDLFYTEFDNKLFWVSGYDVEHNNSYVAQFTSEIIEQAQQFADHVGCKLEEIRSAVVNHSSRYKHMRVFYIEKSEKVVIPKDTYVIKKITEAPHGWTVDQLQWHMWKWLSY